MHWFLTALVIYYLLEIVAVIFIIGRPRQALSPGSAAVIVMLYLGIIAGLLSVGGVLR